MKKWHMEGIVTSTGRSGGKLELPQQSWKIRWEPVTCRDSKSSKGPFLSRYLRSTANRFAGLLR